MRGKIARKSKFLGQLRAKLKKFIGNDHFVKDVELWGPNCLKSGVKLKRIKSLMAKWMSNHINPRLRIKI